MAEGVDHKLSVEEKVFLVKTFYETNNKSETCRCFFEKFNRRTTRETVGDTVKRFEESGTVAEKKRSGRPVVIRTEENKAAVKSVFSKYPTTSTRRAASMLGISKTSILRILGDLGLRPYRPRLVQQLNEDDPDRRIEFCETLLAMAEEDENIFDKIIWTDEAVFKLNGHVNRHNSIYWASENPKIDLERELNVPGISVWVGLSSYGVIGPFFFSSTVTGASYVQMLRDDFQPVIDNSPDMNDFWFQHDGSPAHYSQIARDYLEEMFPDRWIGRRGTVEWPPRSPDLTPPDFFAWGVVKDAVYSTKPTSLSQLRNEVVKAFRLISPELCKKVCRSVEFRLYKCIEAGGWHFEQDY
ncbi:unnamed protein product [Rotaria sordida]|uniref:DUF4817 domain-containing protein n=2 Tax=Rotaria sordida TaxID=392033 RepID=A0A820BI75_9BILA|nr:unnamed protein product [Rotaria sordida]